jgi:hypothetical protein
MSGQPRVHAATVSGACTAVLITGKLPGVPGQSHNARKAPLEIIQLSVRMVKGTESWRGMRREKIKIASNNPGHEVETVWPPTNPPWQLNLASSIYSTSTHCTTVFQI